MRQQKCAVVMPVVAGEPIGHWRLGRRRLERRVSVNHAGGRVEAGIGDAPQPDPAVVARHVFQQPVDRVKRVAALIDFFRAGLLRTVRPHVDKLTFRHVSATHILINYDVAVLAEQGRRPEV